MKKFFILALMVFVVAGGLFAEVAVSGQANNSFATDFEGVSLYQRNDLVVSGSVGDNSSVSVRLRNSGGNVIALDRAWVSTDMAGAFGLDGFGWTMSMGKSDFTMNYDVMGAISSYGGKFRNARHATGGGVQVLKNDFSVADGMVKATVAMVDDASLDFFESYFAGASIALDPVTVILTYGTTAWGTSLDEKVGAGLKFATDMDGIALTVAADFAYGMDTENFGIGAGVNAKLDIANIGVSWKGEKDKLAGIMGVRAQITPMDLLALDLGATLNLDDSIGDTLNDLDIAGVLSLGNAKLRIGYMVYGDVSTNRIADELGFASFGANSLYVMTQLSF